MDYGDERQYQGAQPAKSVRRLMPKGDSRYSAISRDPKVVSALMPRSPQLRGGAGMEQGWTMPRSAPEVAASLDPRTELQPGWMQSRADSKRMPMGDEKRIAVMLRLRVREEERAAAERALMMQRSAFANGY